MFNKLCDVCTKAFTTSYPHAVTCNNPECKKKKKKLNNRYKATGLDVKVPEVKNINKFLLRPPTKS